MKNKTGLIIVVIIVALSGLARGEQSISEDIAEQVESGKNAPAEVPQEQQDIATLKEFEKIMQSYKMVAKNAKPEYISKADHEAMITTTKDYFFDTTNKILWVTGGIVTITLALAGFLMPYLLEKRRDTLNKSLLEKLETQLQSYSDEQVRATKQELHDDINNQIASVRKQLFSLQASRYVKMGRKAFESKDFFDSLMSYLFAVDCYVLTENFDLAAIWASCAIEAAEAIETTETVSDIFDREYCRNVLLNILVPMLLGIHKSVVQSDQYDELGPRLLELSGVVNRLKDQIGPVDPEGETEQ